MAFGKKKQNSVAGGSGKDKPERISNRLDRKIIAESRRLPNTRRVLLIVLGIIVLGIIIGGYLVTSRYEPEPPHRPQVEDPLNGQEPDWAPIFEYKPKSEQ